MDQIRCIWMSLAVGICLLMCACGGGGSSTSGNVTSPPPTPTGPSGGPVSAPIVVTVGSGQTASGVNVSVVPPVASPGENAQLLGVTTGSGGEAFNTGAAIAQGATQQVLLFGPGLSGNMTVTISGPNDIGVSNAQTIKATDGTPGVEFTAAVAPNAALGARTVILQAPNNDITTFTGGLEVVP